MLELARKNKVESMLNFSSGEVYGTVQPAHGKNIEESDYGYTDICNVRSCYAESKRTGETLCVSYAHQFGVPVKTVRSFHTYGPGMALDDGRVFADFTGNIIRNEDIVINSDGSAIRAFCYLTDATKAFFFLVLSDENGESFNMGNPDQAINIRDLATTLIGLYPDKNLKAIFRIPESTDAYLKSPVACNIPEVSKLKALHWLPVVTISDGFKRTIDSYLL
jgi:nucleoside-diphosphate-sugar epimerase